MNKKLTYTKNKILLQIAHTSYNFHDTFNVKSLVLITVSKQPASDLSRSQTNDKNRPIKSADFCRPTIIGRQTCQTTDDFYQPIKSGKWIGMDSSDSDEDRSCSRVYVFVFITA